MEYRGRPSAEAILRDLGRGPRLTVYVAYAPGAGKTRRLLEDAIRLQESGTQVLLGWIETKGRPELDRLAERVPRVPERTVTIGESVFTEFNFEAAVAMQPQVVILDELAHANLDGGAHAKRWQDALALREAGIGVEGAFNIQHLETVAATAESLIGFPVREIVPISFLRAADQVVALDVSPEQLIERLNAGALVHQEDVDRARLGIFRPQTLRYLREMMLRTIDDLTEPNVVPRRTSTLLALATGDGDVGVFLRKASSVAGALDLALDVALVGERRIDPVADLMKELDADVVPLQDFDPNRPALGAFKATAVAIPRGALATRLAGRALERDILVIDPTLTPPVDRELSFSRYTQTAGDRLRIGYGRLTIYLGAAAGCGKTYAMLDRAHQLAAEKIDVVAAFVETHGRADTERLLSELELLPRRAIVHDGVRYAELDTAALLARRPQIALIDELAHTNAPGDERPKRYDDVLAVLRSGISVMTTLNIQHLEGLNDAVTRLTGQRVRETVPDEILTLADEVVLIDTTPETLRERLRAGKIYRPEKVEDALSHFFRTENLAALRELALREVLHARGATRRPPPFATLVLGVKARERDVELIERCARIALRLEIDLTVTHVARSEETADSRAIAALAEATRRVRGKWKVLIATDPLRALIGAAEAEAGATLAVEGARRSPRWPRPVPFARRLLDAGARQLLILAPPLT